MRPLSPSRRALAAMIALGLGGCRPGAAPTSPRPAEAIPRARVDATVGAVPKILAAQHRDPTLADLEEGRTIAAVIYLVLSVAIDPTTIDPEHFLIALDDGRRARPARVLLTPASEPDENRTLVLAVARPTGAEVVRPLAVTITGPLFGAGGEPLSGLAAEVDPIDRPPHLLQALRHEVAAEGACAGHTQLLRTVWSVPIAGGAALDLAAFTLTLADGSRAQPAAAEDHREAPGAMQADDNVIDLCVDQASPVTRLAIPEAAVRDLYGLANAAGEVMITRVLRGG